MAATENRAFGSRPSRGLNNEFEDAWRDMTRDDRPPPRDEDVPEPAEDVSVSHFLLRFDILLLEAVAVTVAASKYVNVSLTSDRAADAPFLFI